MGCWTPRVTFSSRTGIDADWAGLAENGRFRLLERGAERGATAWNLAGDYNAENVTAALLAAGHAGVPPADALRAVAAFGGVKRRLELVGEFGGVRLYDDFAHHPTAIARTLAAVRATLKPQRVLVVTEPRSNTMKLGAHRSEFAAALAGADACWVLRPEGLRWDLDAALAGLAAARVCADTASIVAEVARSARTGDAVIVMSNGGFQNIRADLAAALARTAA
jgi:UDP-N-acetylmuramate: L-alanyl-gamma-D-glutamyl-meso-diaminopimelate ligase